MVVKVIIDLIFELESRIKKVLVVIKKFIYGM